MKPQNLKYSILAVGIISALGTSGAAIAAGSSAGTTVTPTLTSSGQATAQGADAKISNKATASYSVGGTKQPDVTSNEVVVQLNKYGSFTLVATDGKKADDNINENQKIAPGGSVTFNNILTNTGNIDDTFTIELDDTDNDLIPSASDDFAYKNLSTTPIKVTVKNASGAPVSNDPDGTAYPTTITSGQTIKLAAGHKAELSYDVTPNGNPKAGDSGIMTIKATSKYVTDFKGTNPSANVKPTISNEDQGIVTKPIFGIVKSAKNSTINLNTTTEIEYTIKVTVADLEYSADAENFAVTDALPTGLTIKSGSINVAPEAAGTPIGSPNTSGSTTNQLKVTGLDLAKGKTVVITFTATINKSLLTGSSITNNATVYDSFTPGVDPTTNPDVTDSTDDSTDKSKTGVKDKDDSEDPSKDGGDKGSTVTFADRVVTISKDQTIEIAPTDSTTVETTITNTGNETEGDKAGELIITVKDTTPTDEIKPKGNITVTIYDKTGAEIAKKDNIPVNSSGTTEIDANTITNTSGVAPGVPVGGKAVVTYTEESANNTNTDGKPKTSSNTTEVTATLKGTNAPTTGNPVKSTDTFNVKYLELVKKQAIDADCNNSPDSAYTDKAITTKVEVGQCIMYQITAKNLFTSKNITDVVISDLKSNWDSKATYVTGSAVDSNGPANETPTAIESSKMTIPGQGTKSLTFRIQVK